MPANGRLDLIQLLKGYELNVTTHVLEQLHFAQFSVVLILIYLSPSLSLQ